MSNIRHEERDRLEHDANLVRARLATTLDVLDKRGREMVDVKLQAKRHVFAIAIVTGAVLVVVSGLAYALYRLAMRAGRKRLEQTKSAALSDAFVGRSSHRLSHVG